MYVVDDFSDGDLSEYSGSNIQITTTSYGGNGLTGNGSGAIGTAITAPENTFAGEPSIGDTFYVDVYPTGSFSVGIVFAVQSDESHYRFVLEHPDKFEIYKTDSSTVTKIASTTATPTNNQWNRFEVEWQIDGTIVAKYIQDLEGTPTELVNFSVNDVTYTNGGIGYYFDTRDSSVFDNYTNVSASPPSAVTNLQATLL
jgi:hypothetical protein